MGSACLYGNNKINKDVSLEDPNDNDNTNSSKNKNKSSKQLNTEGKENKKSKMSQIIDYFNEGEAERVKEYNKLKKKSKNISKKTNNEKYELMLRRLLDKQNIKMIGHKRRETIRKEGNKIKDIVEGLLKENKNDILKGNKGEINSTLIIKQPPKKRGSTSMTIDKNILSIHLKKKGENFFKKRNSLNEMINKVDSSEFQKHKTINCQADC